MDMSCPSWSSTSVSNLMHAIAVLLSSNTNDGDDVDDDGSDDEGDDVDDGALSIVNDARSAVNENDATPTLALGDFLGHRAP